MFWQRRPAAAIGAISFSLNGLVWSKNSAVPDDATHLLVDRDTKFLPLSDFLENCTDIEPVVLPPKSPNCNAHLERFILSLKSEALDRRIFFGEGSLRNTLKEYTAHDHGERNHQGLGNELIDPGSEVGKASGDIECRERLGGLLRYYHRAA